MARHIMRIMVGTNPTQLTITHFLAHHTRHHNVSLPIAYHRPKLDYFQPSRKMPRYTSKKSFLRHAFEAVYDTEPSDHLCPQC